MNPFPTVIRRLLCVAGASSLILAGGAEARANGTLQSSPRGSDQDSRVTKFCLAAVHAAFEAARKVPPPGIGAYACSCFLDEMNQGTGLGAAQSICRQRALARYSL